LRLQLRWTSDQLLGWICVGIEPLRMITNLGDAGNLTFGKHLALIGVMVLFQPGGELGRFWQ